MRATRHLPKMRAEQRQLKWKQMVQQSILPFDGEDALVIPVFPAVYPQRRFYMFQDSVHVFHEARLTLTVGTEFLEPEQTERITVTTLSPPVRSISLDAKTLSYGPSILPQMTLEPLVPAPLLEEIMDDPFWRQQNKAVSTLDVCPSNEKNSLSLDIPVLKTAYRAFDDMLEICSTAECRDLGAIRGFNWDAWSCHNGLPCGTLEPQYLAEILIGGERVMPAVVVVECSPLATITAEYTIEFMYSKLHWKKDKSKKSDSNKSRTLLDSVDWDSVH